MISFPKITPGIPSAHNRRFRRALRKIAQEHAQPGNGKRVFALLSNLIGGRRLDGHEVLVTPFMAEL